MRYIFEHNQTSQTSATDTQLNTIFGVGTWQQLPNPPADMAYPEWNDTDKKWQNNDLRPYTEKRRGAYPQIAEQLDMLWHALNNGTDLKQSEFYKQIQTIKNKYQKPNTPQ